MRFLAIFVLLAAGCASQKPRGAVQVAAPTAVVEPTDEELARRGLVLVRRPERRSGGGSHRPARTRRTRAQRARSTGQAEQTNDAFRIVKRRSREQKRH